MRVFLTGATGTIGSAVLDNLLAHGHDVTCTARTEQKGQEISSKGAGAHYILFDLNPETAPQLAELAVGYDAIIHTVLNVNEAGIRAEHIATDAFIAAAQKTAETKPVTLLCTSGCLVNGNTNGIIDEEHDDTSAPLQMVAFRVDLEKKVINATAGNLHGAVIRPVSVYGNSHIDQWMKACKANNKIVVLNGNSHIPLIHYADLAEMYRIIIENRGSGLFFASEPESVTIQALVDRFSQVAHIQEIERVDNAYQYIPTHGFFLLGQTFDQQLLSKRLKDLYGYTPSHNFLEWLSTQQF